MADCSTICSILDSSVLFPQSFTPQKSGKAETQFDLLPIEMKVDFQNNQALRCQRESIFLWAMTSAPGQPIQPPRAYSHLFMRRPGLLGIPDMNPHFLRGSS
jgi:hypothetical protein